MTPLGFRKPGAAGAASPAVTGVLPSLFASPNGAHARRSTNFLWSLLLHTLAIAALLSVAPFTPDLKWNPIPPGRFEVREAPLTIRCDAVNGCGGGGGGRESLPASLGVLPRISQQQFVPPSVHTPAEIPSLPMEPTILAPNLELPRQEGPLGDPFRGVLGPKSDGPGGPTGIGTGGPGGVGPGNTPGAGPGPSTGVYSGPFTGKFTAPRPIYAPDPEYSEEARKIRQQGTVTLWVVVGADGRVREMRVQRSLGFGLDEKALEAVRTWRFEPARMDHQPVAVQINVEVRFRLY